MKRFLLIAAVFSLFFVDSAKSNERRFGYVYESATLPKGAREIEVWNTYRAGRDYFYRRYDQRAEFEAGISDNLQGAIYLNYTNILQDPSKGSAGGSLSGSTEVSISSEFKYRLFNSVADPLGMALYGEATLGLNKTELEGKIILDKKIGDFIIALNGVYEVEWKSKMNDGLIDVETEITPQLCFGASYQAGQSCAIGIEGRSHNEIIGGEWEHSALFIGPALSYAAPQWWATLTIMPQVANLHSPNGESGLVLDEHERIEARLLFSFHL